VGCLSGAGYDVAAELIRGVADRLGHGVIAGFDSDMANVFSS